MTKITEINQANAKLLMGSINEKLKELGDYYGVSISLGRMSYDANGLSGSIAAKLLTISPGGSTCTALALHMAKGSGYDVNKPNAKGWKIVDYNSRAHKMPWIVQEHGGKKYKIGDWQAKMLFAQASERSGGVSQASTGPTIGQVARQAMEDARNRQAQAPQANAGQYEAKF